MKLLTEDAVLVCNHELGRVKNLPSQDWVRVGGRRVLVENDPEGRPIAGCPNIGATIKPCALTKKVDTGYSQFVRVGGKPVCLDTVKGYTDGTPPLSVEYKVRTPGQEFVSEVE
jgi:hypothetical protein